MKSFILDAEGEHESWVVTLHAPKNKKMINIFFNPICVSDYTNAIYFWDDACKFNAKKSISTVTKAIEKRFMEKDVHIKNVQDIEKNVIAIFENEF